MNTKASAKIERRQEKQRAAMGFNQAAASHGFSIEPQYAIVVSLIYIGVVIILHMIGKFRKEPAAAPTP
jgi:preprotein translocase subunit Sec61beta